ncbi:Alpha/Beta hydrolase protein [Scleroderma yunnanense]
MSTFDYKHVDGKPICLDVYLPDDTKAWSDKRPTIVYFHGGSLTVGNRQSWFPTWLHRRLSDKGFILISADYRLIPPSTGHDLVEDMQDVFRFVATSLNDRLDETYSKEDDPRFRVDPEAIGVGGTSAGSLCAFLACMHADPKPKVVFSMYGMGGNLLTHQYLIPKREPFLRGREILDPQQFQAFLYPQSTHLEPISDSPRAYHPPDHDTPGYPSNPRMLIGRLYLQLGTYLDYYTGQHDPSLSAHLRSLYTTASTPLAASIPERHRRIFPQLGVSPAWPPTCLVHGVSDTAVLAEESRCLHSLLKAANVVVELWEVPGAEHSFDYTPPIEGMSYEKLFDDIVEFLARHLVPST